jgi:hypothetical protein
MLNGTLQRSGAGPSSEAGDDSIRVWRCAPRSRLFSRLFELGWVFEEGGHTVVGTSGAVKGAEANSQGQTGVASAIALQQRDPPAGLIVRNPWIRCRGWSQTGWDAARMSGFRVLGPWNSIRHRRWGALEMGVLGEVRVGADHFGGWVARLFADGGVKFPSIRVRRYAPGIGLLREGEDGG